MLTPAVLVCGGVPFVLSLFVHVVVWRYWRPAAHMRPLFSIFATVPVLVAVAALVLGGTPALDAVEAAAVLLLYVSLSAAYIQTYPVAQALSPSLAMLVVIARAGPGGMDEAELIRCFPTEEVLHSKIHELVDDGLAALESDQVRLTARGERMARFFLGLRSAIGLDRSEG